MSVFSSARNALFNALSSTVDALSCLGNAVRSGRRSFRRLRFTRFEDTGSTLLTESSSTSALFVMPKREPVYVAQGRFNQQLSSWKRKPPRKTKGKFYRSVINRQQCQNCTGQSERVQKMKALNDIQTIKNTGYERDPEWWTYDGREKNLRHGANVRVDRQGRLMYLRYHIIDTRPISRPVRKKKAKAGKKKSSKPKEAKKKIEVSRTVTHTTQFLVRQRKGLWCQIHVDENKCRRTSSKSEEMCKRFGKWKWTERAYISIRKLDMKRRENWIRSSFGKKHKKRLMRDGQISFRKWSL